MKLLSQRWLVVSTISLSIGSIGAIAERLIGTGVDSFLPDAGIVANYRRPGSITFLSTNEKVLQKIGPATRQKILPGSMPLLIKQAFIAAEDRRFYTHKGVDLWGIIRALSQNLKKGGVIEGGSTITQQLARIVFLSQERTIGRKMKEISLAFKLERKMSKDEILEQYLNNVYLGANAYGISDAAWVYFKKTPYLLKLEEIALIARFPPPPSLYSPLVNLDLAIEKRAIVLFKMLQEDFINERQYNEAINKPLNLKPSLPKYYKSEAPFFTSWANQQLPRFLTPEQIEFGGLKIKTSLNLKWQKHAQQIIKSQKPENIEGAIVSIEPKSGLVRVLVGGKDFESNQFNRATQALRSPGSTFKIFPYLAALKYGYTPETIFLDKRRCWSNYCPKNFGNKYMGKVSLNNAFKESLNTVAVDLLDKVGFESVISIANNLGISKGRDLGKYYPLAIGAYEQTVLEMTAAYAGVTNRGVFITPIAFEEIRGPRNNLLWRRGSKEKLGKVVLQKQIADTMNWMLQQVVKTGTGQVASIEGRSIAGKTGTSEGGRDLWFIGSIPQLTTGVWLGFDDNRETKGGGGDAAWTWKKFMNKLENDFEVINFAEKPNL